MKERTFILICTIIFLAVFVLHLLRLVYSWNAVIGTWVVPTWVSGVAVAVSAFLVFTGYRLQK